MARTVPVPVHILAAYVENLKRVTPRGTEDGDRLHALVAEGERLLGIRHDVAV